MQISTKAFYFGDLEVGELFMWEDEIYLKTELFKVDEKQFRNAVCLEDNCITCFEDDEPISPKQGKLTIY